LADELADDEGGSDPGDNDFEMDLGGQVDDDSEDSGVDSTEEESMEEEFEPPPTRGVPKRKRPTVVSSESTVPENTDEPNEAELEAPIPRGRPRRNRIVMESDEGEGVVDLTRHSFLEGKPVNALLVPAANGATCARCAKSGKSDCVPVWHLHHKQVKIRCVNCKVAKNQCSFKLKAFKIRGAPALRRSDKTQTDRDFNNATKHVSLALLNPDHSRKSKKFQEFVERGMIVVSSDGESDGGMRPSKRPRVSRSLVAEVKMAATKSTPQKVTTLKRPKTKALRGSLVERSPITSNLGNDDEFAHSGEQAESSKAPSFRLHREVIEFQDLTTYHKILCQPGLDSGVLRDKIVELREGRTQEDKRFAEVQAIFEDRAGRFELLIAHAERRLGEVECEESEG